MSNLHLGFYFYVYDVSYGFDGAKIFYWKLLHAVWTFRLKMQIIQLYAHYNALNSSRRKEWLGGNELHQNDTWRLFFYDQNKHKMNYKINSLLTDRQDRSSSKNNFISLKSRCIKTMILVFVLFLSEDMISVWLRSLTLVQK